MPGKKKLPSTLDKSPKHAQEIFRETLAAAEKEYGQGQRASQTAYASLKHSYERGSSDPEPGRDHETFGGVDVNGHTKDELWEMAQRLGAKVNLGMTKYEIARAIDRRNRQTSRK